MFKWSLIFYSLFYAEACNELGGPISASLRRAAQLLWKKRCSGGEPLSNLCPIWSVGDLNLRPPAPETNELLLHNWPVGKACWICSAPSNHKSVASTSKRSRSSKFARTNASKSASSRVKIEAARLRMKQLKEMQQLKREKAALKQKQLKEEAVLKLKALEDETSFLNLNCHRLCNSWKKQFRTSGFGWRKRQKRLHLVIGWVNRSYGGPGWTNPFDCFI